MPFQAVINNITLLLALSISYGLVVRKWQHDQFTLKVVAGILFGLVAIAGMINSFKLSPGIIFDGRSVVVSVAGLFLGPLTAAISAVIASCYRTWLGGSGTLSGVLTLVCSGLIGTAGFYLCKKKNLLLNVTNLILFGLLVHIVLFVIFYITLPPPYNVTVFKHLAFPFLAILPIGTVILGKLIDGQNERIRVEKELQMAHEELEKRVEERTAELEIANNELKDFAYIVSHDLKAPLRAVSQLSYWLGEDYREKLDAGGQEKIDLLISRVKRMDRLIEGILTYSRIGRVREKDEAVNLNTLINSLVESLAPPDSITITIENELPVITGERIRIEQLFQNLLSNAVKFMDKPAGKINIGSSTDESEWKFWVSDNGAGIDPKYHDKIFQIFQTLSPRDEFESTGIGLTLVKKIIELYGGTIRVDSEEGSGSTFSFTLPRKGGMHA